MRGEISEERAVSREEIFVGAVRCDICSRCCVPGRSRSPEGVAKFPKILTKNSGGGIYALFAPADLSEGSAEVLEWVKDAQKVQHTSTAELEYLKPPGMQSYEDMQEEIIQKFLAPKTICSEEPATSWMEGSRGRCLFYELPTQEEESIEESVGAACANPRPTDFDVACAFLDAEDVEVNVHEADSNTEFLEGNLEVALDSGAGDHVTAETEAPAYTVEESPGSRVGQHFLGAGGHRMPNKGQMKLDLRADNGKRGRDIKAIFQVAKVTRPLMSVSKICDAGLAVKFTKDLALVVDAKDKEVCRFQRRGGLYVASMKMRNPNFKPEQRFARPGTK